MGGIIMKSIKIKNFPKVEVFKVRVGFDPVSIEIGMNAKKDLENKGFFLVKTHRVDLENVDYYYSNKSYAGDLL